MRRRVLVRKNSEHRSELGHLQELGDTWLRVDELDVATEFPHRRARRHHLTHEGAVHIS